MFTFAAFDFCPHCMLLWPVNSEVVHCCLDLETLSCYFFNNFSSSSVE